LAAPETNGEFNLDNVISSKPRRVIMPSLQRLESQVAALPESELRQFRSWFDDFDAQRWDQLLAADINCGKLDEFAHEALAHYAAGQCKPL
jgi:hypothetical protein